MTLVIQSGNQILSSQEIIPLLARYQMLPQLISQRIIDRAIAAIECTDEEKNIACQQFYQQHHLTTEAERQAWAASHCLNQKDIEELATRQVKIEKFKLATWQEQLPSYFLRRKKELDQAIYSLIRTRLTLPWHYVQFAHPDSADKERKIARLSSRSLDTTVSLEVDFLGLSIMKLS